MKIRMLTLGTVVLMLCMSLTACKSNEETLPDAGAAAPDVTQNGETAGTPNYNGVVTDHNGLIGDADDTAVQNSHPIEKAVDQAGNAVRHAADKAGEAVSDLTSGAGRVVSDMTDTIGDALSDKDDRTNSAAASR